VLLVVMVMFFLSLDLSAVRNRAGRLRAARPRVAAALSDFARRVRTYWVVSTVFGLVVAALDVFALALLGVPLALTWGILAFVTNYIPNIGFVIGLVPPALLALLEGDLVTMVWVIVVYSVINFTLQSLIQPKFVGDAVGLNPTVTFLSLVFWSFVVGPLGAILAVPLTLFLHAVLVGQDPDRRWARTLLAGTSGAATTERHTVAGRRSGWPRPGRRAGGAATPPASAQPDEPAHRVPVRPSA